MAATLERLSLSPSPAYSLNDMRVILQINLITNVQLTRDNRLQSPPKQRLQGESRQRRSPLQFLGVRPAQKVPHEFRVPFPSSSKNSEDAPDWMSRTQSYHYRGSNRNRSLHMNPASPFKQVEQTYVYAGLTRAVNP